MLHYQSTSFHDALYVRRLLGLRPAPEFEAWLVSMGIVDGEGRLKADAARRLVGGAAGWPERRLAAPG
jgi:ethanolamine ammonia-lyase large subunit